MWLPFISSLPISQLISKSEPHSWTLVTGSSDGIGKGLAVILAVEYGFNVVIHGRNYEKLEKLRDEILTRCAKEGKRGRETEVMIIVADAKDAQNIDYEETFVRPLSGLHLTLLINNAGVACSQLGDAFQRLTEFTLNDVTSIINVNNVFTVMLTKNVLPLISKHNQPSLIVNTSSFVSFLPTPHMATYSASKAFINSFTTALNNELSLDPQTAQIHSQAILVGNVQSQASPEPTSLMKPSAEDFARSTCRVLNDGNIIRTGYWAHSLQATLLQILPTWMVNIFINKIAIESRKKRIEGNEKRK